MIPFGGVEVRLSHLLPVGLVRVIDGVIYARGWFDISEQIRREQRRLDAYAAFTSQQPNPKEGR